LEETSYLDIKAYRFAPNKLVLEDPRKNEDNRCYCPEENVDDCYLAGAISLAACKSGNFYSDKQQILFSISWFV